MLRAIGNHLVVAMLAILTSNVSAENVVVSINQTTTLGNSVFVLSDLPEMGAGNLTKAPRLSPLAGVQPGYPIWSATFDLPPGTTFTPRFYTRNDSPTQLSNAGNGTLVSTGASVTVPGVAPAAHAVSIYASAAVVSGTATISSPVDGSTVTSIPMSISTISGGKLASVSIPATHASQGRNVRFSLSDGTILPTDSAVAIGSHDVWFRFGQAFLYDPGTLPSTPSAPRVETFSFNPVAPFQTRNVDVMLPRNYDSQTSRRYPVLYAQDGQNLIFPGGGFGYWDLNVAVNTLTARGEMPETIVIGIDNSSDRLIEYVPEYGNVSGTGRGGEFLTMMRNELLPIVNSGYRTLTGPENTAHLGSSLGGLLGFHAANEFEATWGTVVAMSSSFQVNNAENNNRASLPISSFGRLYIDSGTAGASNDGYANTATVRDRRLSVGESIGPRFTHAIGLGDDHNEAAWRGRSPNALRWLYAESVDAPAGVAGWESY